MRRSILKALLLIGALIGCLSTSPGAHAGKPVPASFSADLQSLFNKYYPDVTFTNQGVNGIHFQFKVTTFKFPPLDATEKRENPVQRGPKKGGILCSVYLETGTYGGQLALMPRGAEQCQTMVIDKQEFKQLLAAPYSQKRDAHLWLSLSYPSNVSDDFLKDFRALLIAFEKDVP